MSYQRKPDTPNSKGIAVRHARDYLATLLHERGVALPNYDNQSKGFYVKEIDFLEGAIQMIENTATLRTIGALQQSIAELQQVNDTFRWIIETADIQAPEGCGLFLTKGSSDLIINTF